jgi:hypothetical protein
MTTIATEAQARDSSAIVKLKLTEKLFNCMIVRASWKKALFVQGTPTFVRRIPCVRKIAFSLFGVPT